MQSIVEALKHFAETTPETVAVIAEDEKISYKDLYKKVSAFAVYLTEKGVKKGDNIVIKASHTIDYVVAVLGVHLCGAVNVPCEKTLGDDGLVQFIDRMHSNVLVADSCPSGADVVFIPRKEVRTVPEKEFNGELPKSTDLCDILFTTGSTGKSKGVMLSHRNVTAVIENVQYGADIKPGNVYLVAAPLNHAASIRKIYVSVWTGTTVVLFDGFMNLRGYFDYMRKYKVTSCHMPPSAIRMIIQLTGDAISEFSDQLDHIHTGSAAFPEADKERITELLPNTRLYYGYGSSEAGCSCLYNYAAFPGKINCAGKPNVNAKLITVDENRKPVKATRENPQRLAVMGDMIMQGYYEADELTKSVIDENGIFYSSDLGYIDDEGFVYMIGRADDVINIGGLKIAPTEVEAEVLRVKGVVEAACFATENRMGGFVPNLAVVMDKGCVFDKKLISEFLLNNLEAFKVPKNIFEVDDIPKKPNGKPDRQKFKELIK